MENSELVRQLMEKKVIVKVDGYEFELRCGTEAISSKLREYFAKDLSHEGAMSLGLKVSIDAVAYCVDISPEEAEYLVLKTGGEYGELARTARDLCGVGPVLEAFFKGQADIPFKSRD